MKKWEASGRKREARAKLRNVDDSGRNRAPKSEQREPGKPAEQPRKSSAAQRAEHFADLQSWPPALHPSDLWQPTYGIQEESLFCTHLFYFKEQRSTYDLGGRDEGEGGWG